MMMLRFPKILLSRFARLLMVGAVVFASSWLPAAEPEVGEGVDFSRDVRPILANHCFTCHGPDANQREADLRLDLRESAIASDAIVPGVARASDIGSSGTQKLS